MTSMPQTLPTAEPQPVMSRVVICGIDTRKDLCVAAVIDTSENVLGARSFSTARASYRALIRWARSYGDIARIGVGHRQLRRRHRPPSG